MLKRVAAFGVASVGMALLLFVAVRSYRQEQAVFFPKRRPFEQAPAEAKIPGLEEVAFGSGSGTLRGWYAPSSRRAAVILIHGAGGNRASLLGEARALAAQGFGVLTYDLPGHGNSDGEVHWSEGERASLRAAFAWLSKRSDVDPNRIGAFGFSLGGYVLAQVAAAEPGLRALVFAGTPSDPVAQVRAEHGSYWLLSELPALWVLRRGGLELDVRAIDFMPKLGARPVLVVTGGVDGTVPKFMADELYGALGGPKELYVLPLAGHGDYGRAGPPGAYEQRIVEFFARTLG
jgi:fermentation-respiration switch protein FrsA (DUF1100 family)